VANYLDFVAYAYPIVLQTDDPNTQTASLESDATLSVGVEKSLKLGFTNSYLSKTLILTKPDLDILIDFVDSGQLQAEYPDVNQVKAKEVLIWLKDILENRTEAVWQRVEKMQLPN